MGSDSRNKELVNKAEMIIATRDYEKEEREEWDQGVDFVASPAKSDDRVLIRVITEPKTKSGTVGVDTIRETIETLEKEEYDKSVVISRKFSKAARREMREEGIKIVSKKIPPSFKPVELYSSIRECVDDLCKAKCGQVPKKKTDCKGLTSGHYTCKIRLVSDNASFHFSHGWNRLLQKDFEKLIRLRTS